MQVTAIGIDLAKNLFQLHGVNAEGQVVLRKRLRRAAVLPFFANLAPCLIGMEASAGAHHWARELRALGHDVKLMAPSYVKPYVKRGKNDAVDAEANCEAVTRPNMRFVPIKNAEQQSVLMLHRARELLIRQQNDAGQRATCPPGRIRDRGAPRDCQDRTTRGHRQGRERRSHPLARARCADHDRRPDAGLRSGIADLEAEIVAWHRADPASCRLATIPGIGAITASAIAATISDPSYFRSGRQLAAWLGLTPRQHSSGGKERLGRISKQGDRYIRWLLVMGALSVIRYARTKAAADSQWINQLLSRRSARVVSVAIANKMARVIWAILAREQAYRAPLAAAA